MATFFWNGGSGDWSDANWTITGTPTPTIDSPSNADDVFLDGSSPYTLLFGFPADDPREFGLPETAKSITLDDAAATLELGENIGVNGTVAINAGVLRPIVTGALHAGAVANTGGTVVVTGVNLYSFEETVFNDALFSFSGGVLSCIGFSNSATGTLSVANSGTMISDGMTNAGTITLASGGDLNLLGGVTVPSGQVGTIRFLDASGAVLRVANQQPFQGTIDGFQAGNRIELTGLVYDPSFQTDYVGGMLYVSSGTGEVVASLALAGISPRATFAVAADTLGEPEITTSSVPCLAQGTRVLTRHGWVPVDRLVPGDEITLPDGRHRPVVWLGHRRLACRRHPRPHDVHPVRLRPHAFGRNRPHADLWLSPDHAVMVEGVLIPVRYLVNGATVVQEPVDHVTYWHVELDRHDVMLAEGLAVESYLDTGNRDSFDNCGDTTRLFADFARGAWRSRACTTLALDGPPVIAARRQLLAEATPLGWATSDEPELTVLVDGGIAPIRRHGSTCKVRLPPASCRVRIGSRCWTPAHAHPESNDHRRLGVAVADLRLDGQAISLDDPRLSSGWHASERDWRWTDGDAELALAGVRELGFDLAMVGTYWHHESENRLAAAA